MENLRLKLDLFAPKLDLEEEAITNQALEFHNKNDRIPKTHRRDSGDRARTGSATVIGARRTRVHHRACCTGCVLRADRCVGRAEEKRMHGFQCMGCA